MEINLTSLIPQFGLSAIFIYAAFRLYKDQREDSTRREIALMAHLDKVSDTLNKIDERLCTLEHCAGNKEE
jgi:hypothetical protein